MDFPLRRDGPELKVNHAIIIASKRFIIFTVVTLVIFGLLMVASATVNTRILKELEPFSEFTKQGIFALAGILLMIFMSRLKLTRNWLTMFVYVLFLFSLISLFLCYIEPFAHPQNNAFRWIELFYGFSFQPSEVLKISLPLFLICLFLKPDPANELSVGNKTVNRSYLRILVAFIVLALVGFLVLYQPDFGTFLLLTFIGILSLLLSTFLTNPRMFLIALILLIIALIGFISLKPGKFDYIYERVTTWQNPLSDPDDKGFQIVQALGAIHWGGSEGVGFMRGIQTSNHLPDAEDDFIFAVIIEEFGLQGGIILILFYAGLGFLILLLVFNLSDPFSKAAVTTLGFSIILQACASMMCNTAILPTKGITLPLISSGGSSLITTLFSIGFILMIANRALSKPRRRQQHLA